MALIRTFTTLLLPAIMVLGLGRLLGRRNRTTNLAERSRGQTAPQERGSVRSPGESFQHLSFWVHAVSAGEVMGAVPLVKGLQARFPSARVVLSTLTATGEQMARQHCGDIEVTRYRHIDFFLNATRLISDIQPTIFLPVEAEVWPSLMRRLSRRGVPCVLLNARVSRRRLRYRLLYESAFRRIAFFGAQTEADAERLAELGVSRGKIAVTGNTKFSQAESAAKAETKPLPLPEGGRLLIGGSTHEGEETELLRAYARLAARRRNVFLLLAPRHLERLERVERLVIAQRLAFVRWSQIGGKIEAPVIILDTMGQLAQLYGQATAVFVGGSWVKRGGHNILEPAAWGKPIFFGPHMENFASIAAALVGSGAAREVRNGEELAARMEELLDHPEKLAEMGRLARRLIEANQDAVKKSLEIVENVLIAAHKIGREPVGVTQSTARSALDAPI